MGCPARKQRRTLILRIREYLLESKEGRVERMTSNSKVFRILFLFLTKNIYCYCCYSSLKTVSLIYIVKYNWFIEIEFIVLVTCRHLRALKSMSKCLGERISLAYLGSLSISLYLLGPGWYRILADKSLFFWIGNSLKGFNKTGQTLPFSPSRTELPEETQSTH